ncbi:Uncharacterised protein [Orientia tsutsugamushi]|nr:Uncharacterised protein [Orientia tsutsugamushi]
MGFPVRDTLSLSDSLPKSCMVDVPSVGIFIFLSNLFVNFNYIDKYCKYIYS